jgi:hypothetical protein
MYNYFILIQIKGNLALSRAIGDFEFKQSENLSAEEQVVTCKKEGIKDTGNIKSH